VSPRVPRLSAMTAKSQLMVPIRAVRKAYGLSIEELVERIAEQGHVVEDTATIRNVETGNKRPSDRLRFAWAQALGLSPLDARVIPGADGTHDLPLRQVAHRRRARLAAAPAEPSEGTGDAA
jgi:transcriptional regulator with XRE-family HTH domain